jgi:hypothetical protein
VAPEQERLARIEETVQEIRGELTELRGERDAIRTAVAGGVLMLGLAIETLTQLREELQGHLPT